MSTNELLAKRLSLIARMQELLGMDKFRAISNERAARAIEGHQTDMATLVDKREALLEIEGIGPKTADKIIEFCRTGKITELEELKSQVPAGLMVLFEVPGLGPKTIRVFWTEAGVTDMAGLKKIINNGSILKLPRMGEKAVQKLKDSLALVEQGGKRLQLGLAVQVAERFVARLKKVPGVEKAEPAGSLRRGKETVGDIDILVVTNKPAAAAAAAEAFRTMPEVRHVLVAGDTRSSVRAAIMADMGNWGDGEAGAKPETDAGTIQVDLRVLPKESWGAAMMYFTGSKEHNIRLRELAQRQGRTLNDYGLYPEDEDRDPPHKRGIKSLAGKTEEEVYKKLGMAWVPPEIREDRGELDLMETPRLVEIGDIKAELHAHTTASDGVMTIVQLANEAKKRGYHTIAVTDHSKSSVIANGLTPERLKKHIKAIHAAREEVEGITILAGSEVDILADGKLDYPDSLLAELDIVVASPHAALSQDPATATKRLIKAIENKHVRILGHPTGRYINKRAGLAPEMGAVIAAAKANDVALEINAHWMRLDLRDTHVRAAVEAGCRIAIDCDVHEPKDFENLRFGIVTGRRGWLTPELCVNTWPAKRLQEWVAGKK